MRRAPAGNIPIEITKTDEIKISGRLVKSNRLAHGSNIGALSLISATIRALDGKKEHYYLSLKSNMLTPK